MIIDISNLEFKNLWEDEKLFLPIRWDGYDFLQTLNGLFDYYIKKLDLLPNNGYDVRVDSKVVKRACGYLSKAVAHYLNGFPSKAYSSFKSAMNIFMDKPLKIYQKSAIEQFEDRRNHHNTDDSLKLFRVTAVGDNKPYGRERVFHTPYNLRSKVSTNRYSIAGYPSLYLGTSLELCCEETHINPRQDFALASIFKLERTLEYSNTNIQVIELGVKPQDFLNNRRVNERFERRIESSLLDSSNVRAALGITEDGE